ncbi:hypothetical protein [Halopseudomonas salegens]|uniref:Uncharacterized protein n=1 Tax=Halopseudomonas salegens TaxID=1434072 RepID=A0A1H2FVU8_9GAMM|nr:hypothetical protein [Halopseudomonas salegens]SDU11494.1 hypothetical protein SAMN05216210_1842 [Halopseudomonas salegens]
MTKVIIAALSIVFFASPVMAEEQQDGDDSDLPAWGEERVDRMHDSVSRWVTSTSRNLDGFISREYPDYDNTSYLRLRYTFDWEEAETNDHDLSVRFRLDLPTTEERLRLILESEPEESRGTLAEQGTGRLTEQQTSTSNTILGLSRLSGRDKREQWNFRTGAGIRLRLPLDPYVRVSAERLWGVGNGPWQLSSDNRASWFNKEGYSARSRWDLGRPLDERRHFRFVTTFQWQEDEDTLEFSESIELHQKLSNRSAMRYAAVMIGNSLSNPRINDYYLQAYYRRDIHRDRVFLDLIPELQFPRRANFDPRWAFTMRFELYFRGLIQRTQYP